jgi:hypothetical protein
MLTDRAAQILKTEWADIRALAEGKKLKDWLVDPRLIKAVNLSVNSSTKTYRYVLPTQVLSKLADPSLDSRCLQLQRGGPGAFDARTIAHEVIVPFDQDNENVLGGSQEPYVSNPLRVAEVSAAHRGPQRNKPGWDQLCFVLNDIEEKDEDFARVVFRQILTEIYRRLSTVRVVYGIPRRVSLRKTLEGIQTFLSEHSGGDRLLALSSALFTVIGKRFGLYEKVRRGKITSADQSSGMLADLECITKEGRIILAVEVKDRQITISQLRAKLRSIREKQVSEIFFVAQGTVPFEEADVQSLIDREFTGGQNVYMTDLVKLSATALSIVGEDGRRDFLSETANQLEMYKSEITHRRAWASILAAL